MGAAPPVYCVVEFQWPRGAPPPRGFSIALAPRALASRAAKYRCGGILRWAAAGALFAPGLCPTAA